MPSTRTEDTTIQDTTAHTKWANSSQSTIEWFFQCVDYRRPIFKVCWVRKSKTKPHTKEKKKERDFLMNLKSA